jgi:hypothetical protein
MLRFGVMRTRVGASRSPAYLLSTEPPVHACADSTANELLKDNSYHIEFEGYLTNHAKHAVIGLHGLQAPSSTIRDYWDLCDPLLQPFPF